MGREPAELLLQRIRAWGDAQPDIRAVVVTGSYARGQADALSDLDLELGGDAGVKKEIGVNYSGHQKGGS